MIVDDESVIRNGVLCLINWQELHCEVVYEAANGINARNFLESNPVDIVVSDIKMPGMDGLHLSKYIYESYPNTKVIILTAFADFSYAQSAIKYNVVDFIVKTSYVEKLPEAVCKAKELISKQKEKENKIKLLQDNLSENMTEVREKFIKDVLNGIVINHEVIENRLKHLNIQFHNYFIISYEINPSIEVTTDINEEEHNKFTIAVKNFLSLASKDYNHLTMIMNKNTLISIVSFTSSSTAVHTKALLMTCNEILSMVEGFMKFAVCIGISQMHSSTHELSLAYKESLEALSCNFYSENNVSVYMKTPEVKLGLEVNPTHQYTDEIVSGIQHGDPKYAISSLMKLFDKFRNDKEAIEQVKISSMLLCSTCFRLLANYKLDENDYSKNEISIYHQIQNIKSLKSLSFLLSDVIKSVANLIYANNKQDNYLVREVNKFIRTNYNKAINLQIIADYVHVNSSYLSSLYKKQTGESLIDALNKYRVEIAKKLLMDSSKKVFEVAIAVGIEDPAYFTHVFTKYSGVSPKEYKSKT